MNRIRRLALPLLLAAACSARAESQWRVPVYFAYTNDAGYGNSWFVVGSHPDLGDWDPLRAVPLACHDGNVWSADIGLRAGANLPSSESTGYKFVKRPTNAAEYPVASNTEWMDGANLSISVPAEADAPYSGKRVVFRCDWPEPVEFCYSMLSTSDFESTNAWTNVVMKKTGDGRFEVDGVGEPGEWMRFTFHQTSSNWWYHFRPTDEEETDFWTPLDAFCVRDGQVFDYEPVPTADGWVSGPRFEEREVHPWPEADTEGVASRTIRIYLPRGYNENTNRYYPVLYFADGQNIFSDQHSSADAWGVDTAANREIRAGHMREAILVGVPCRETPPPGASDDYTWAGRLWEYLPGTDNLYMSQQLLGHAIQGNGFHYMNFLLGNVVPTLDYNYRTLRDPANTGHVGSSAGGLLSFWLAAYTNRFGLVGAVSGVYNNEYIPEFRKWCEGHIGELSTNKIKRIWLDTGTEETEVLTLNLYQSNWDALTLLLYAGQIPNKTLHFGVYTGAYGRHNEYAWAARSADILRFLLPVTDEFNPLLPRELSVEGNAIKYPVYPGSSPSLLHYPTLVPMPEPTTIGLDTSTDHPWTTGVYTNPAAGFYRLLDTPPPVQVP